MDGEEPKRRDVEGAVDEENAAVPNSNDGVAEEVREVDSKLNPPAELGFEDWLKESAGEDSVAGEEPPPELD